jgi:hypothetical protein
MGADKRILMSEVAAQHPTYETSGNGVGRMCPEGASSDMADIVRPDVKMAGREKA